MLGDGDSLLLLLLLNMMMQRRLLRLKLITEFAT